MNNKNKMKLKEKEDLNHPTGSRRFRPLGRPQRALEIGCHYAKELCELFITGEG